MARRQFRSRGNEACADLAEFIRLWARLLMPGRPGPVAARAQLLASRLRAHGLGNDADLAQLIAARALMAAGREREARDRIAVVRRRGPAVSLDVILMRRLAQAELDERDGRPAAAMAELRAGLATANARRARLGSIDLQTASTAVSADLAAAGLRLALDRGSARMVFAWLERSRAQAFRVRPVRPPDDPQLATAQAELRQLSYVIRNAELSGQRDAAAIRKHAELVRELTERGWQASGPGEISRPATLRDISQALEESGNSLVALLAHEAALHAVVLRNRSLRLFRLGDGQGACEASRRLSADLDTLARRRLPTGLETAIKDSIRCQLRALTAEILAPLRPALGDGGVVLLPSGALAAVPWNMLPDLRGRPVTVCPSASSWLAAWRRDQAAPGAGAGPPLLVAGPDLTHASREVAGIAQIYPGSRILQSRAAGVDATLRALDGAALAHLAAHGHHDRENVLFSRLYLADGALMAHQLQQLRTPPRHVVLSACDVGRTVVRPGDEILGFTAALLYTGTATVISSVTRLADDAAVGVMTSYHRGLRAGARPAEALAQATANEPVSPFVCFGSG
jgi:hypothetical protein